MGKRGTPKWRQLLIELFGINVSLARWVKNGRELPLIWRWPPQRLTMSNPDDPAHTVAYCWEIACVTFWWGIDRRFWFATKLR